MPSQSDKRKPSTDTYQLNYRLLLGTAGVVLALSIAGYFWFGFVQRRVAIGFTERARVANQEAVSLDETAAQKQQAGDVEEAADLSKQARQKRAAAVKMLWQYIQMRPDDEEIRVELANVYGDLPESERSSQRAMELYRGAISKVSESDAAALRIRLAELLNEAAEYAEAEKECLRILEPSEGSTSVSQDILARAWSGLAISLAGLWNQADGRKPATQVESLKRAWKDVFQQALDLNPKDWRLALTMAELLRGPDAALFLTEAKRDALANQNQSTSDWADSLVDQACQANPDDWQARVNYFLYLEKYKRPGAFEQLEQAAASQPTNGSLQFMLGQWHLNQVPLADRVKFEALQQSEAPAAWKSLEQARACFDKALSSAEAPLDTYAGLAETQWLLGESEAAKATWIKGIEVSDRANPNLYQRLIRYYLSTNELDLAAARLEEWQNKTTAESRKSDVNPRQLNEQLRAQDFMRGVLALNRDRLNEALESFNRIIIAENRSGTRVLDVYRLLGEVFSTRNAPGQAAHYFELAADLAPNDANLARLAGLARAELGQLDLARSHLEQAVAIQPSVENLLDFTEILLQSQLQRLPADREWSGVQSALARAQKAAETETKVDAERIERLRASIDLAQNPLSPAEVALGADSTPEQLLAWIGTYRSVGNQAEVNRLTELYINKLQNESQKTLAKVQLLVDSKQLDEAMKLIQETLPGIESAEEKQTLQLTWAQLELLQQKPDLAMQRLEALYRDAPTSSRLLAALATAAIELNQIAAEPTWWEAKLPDLEGQDGPYQRYYSVYRTLSKIETLNNASDADALLKRAEEQIRQALQQQSDWPPAITLLGRVHDVQLRLAEQQTDRDPAVIASLKRQAQLTYQQAFQIGDRRPATLLRLSQLTDSPEEAAAILALLDPAVISEYEPLSSRLTGLKLAIDQLESAEQIARDATVRRPQDTTAWLNLALVKIRKNDLIAAEESATTARQRALEAANPRDELGQVFQYYLASANLVGDPQARQRQVDQARGLIDKLVELEKDQSPAFVRGALLDAIDDGEAAKWYLEAEKADPERIDQLQAMVDFFSRRNVPGYNSLDEAIRIATKLSKLQPNDVPTQSLLARLLTARGRPEDWEQASQILRSTSRFNPNTPEGSRAQAVLLWERRDVPKPVRTANLQTITDLLKPIAETSKNPDDLLFLGSAYLEWSDLTDQTTGDQSAENLGKLASEAFARVSQMAQLGPDQLMALALGLIERRDWERAETIVQRLQSRLAQERIPNPAPLALRVEIGLRQGDPKVRQTAEPELIRFIESLDKTTQALNDLQKARIYVQVATIWESLGQSDQSLEWYRKASQLSAELLNPLVQALVRNGQKSAALQVCEQAFQRRPIVDVVFLVSSILTTGRTSDDEFRTAEPLLKQLQEKFGDDLACLTSLANIRSVQPGKIEEAIALYRAGLKKDSQHLVLLNNLATVLGELSESREEALELINRAISLGGEIPDLLNTKARILVNRGELAAARKLLQAITRRQADPRFWWQLAEVEWMMYQQSKNDRELKSAQDAWQKALANGIESSALTPGELERMEMLRANLQPATSTGTKQ